MYLIAVHDRHEQVKEDVTEGAFGLFDDIDGFLPVQGSFHHNF